MLEVESDYVRAYACACEYRCSNTHNTSARLVLQGRIYYEAIGDYPAPSFFHVDNTTGDVTVRSDLRTDNLQLGVYTVSKLQY